MDTLTERCERTRERLLALAHDAEHEPVATQSVAVGFVTVPRNAVGTFQFTATVALPGDGDLAGKMLAALLLTCRAKHRYAFDQALHRLKSQNLLPPNL